MFSSYELGYTLGYLRGIKWVNKNKTTLPIAPVAKSEFTQYVTSCTNLSEADFIDGFTDGIEACFRGEKLAIAG